MHARLREHLVRGRITPLQCRAGEAWFGDWLATGRELAGNRPDRDRGCRAGTDSGDVMRAAARQRVRRVEAALGGRDHPHYRVAHHVVLADGEAGAIAERLGIRPTSAMDMLRLALVTVAGVYRLGEHA